MFKTRDEESDFWMRGKAVAMKEAIADAYTKSGGSWKNIMSFGDSDFERFALKKVGADHMSDMSARAQGHLINEGDTAVFLTSDGHLKRLRTKTVKMLEDPSVDMMIAEITLLCEWLPHIIVKDFGIDIEIADADDDVGINKIHHALTGRNDNLTWLALAGLDSDG